jgi:peroxiredoxin (alkyl hydroperoxide reductase subunit C)
MLILTFKLKGEVCPANWEEGKDAMNADRNSTAAYLASKLIK